MLRTLRDAWRVVGWSSAPGPDDVVIGRSAAGEPVCVPVGWSVLVAGLPGAGKSSTLRTIVAGLLERDDVTLWAIDAKGGVEAAQYAPALGVLAVDQADALDVAHRLLEEVHARARWLRAEHRTVWPRSADDPVMVLVVDELAAITHTGGPLDREVAQVLAQVVALGRAVGVSVIAATQRPAAEVVPTWLRDLFALRIAHALARRTDVAMILGDALDGPGPETLPLGPAGAGHAYVLVEGERTPRRCRIRWTSTHEVADLARRRAIPTTTTTTSTSATTSTSITTPITTTSTSATTSTSWPPPCPTPTPMTPAERPGSTPKALPTTTTPGPALTALQGRVWAVVADRGPVSVPTIAAALGAPERRVREVCAELAATGLITRTGTRWNTSTTGTADGGARRPARRDGAPGAAPTTTTITPPPAPAPTPTTVSVRFEENDFRIGVR